MNRVFLVGATMWTKGTTKSISWGNYFEILNDQSPQSLL